MQQLKEQQKETQNRLHTAKDIYIKSTHEAIIELLEEKIDQTSKRIEGMIKQKESLNIEYQNLQTIPAIGKIFHFKMFLYFDAQFFL